MNESTAITVITPKNLTEARELATQLAGARTIPEALQKSPADVLAIVMAGGELGLAPMQSIRALVLIKGKPTLSADAMGALVKSRRDVCQYLQLKASTASVATYVTQRVGEPEPTTMSFTIDEAKAAGLNGDNWRKFPAAMLRARALSAICRAVYQDLLLGVYDPEELAPDREEKDVTPTLANSPATVDGLKAELRTRRMVVSTDVTPPAASPPRPVEQPADDPATVGWGKNGHLRLDGLTVEQLQWYVDDARKKAEGGDALWGARWNRYGIALAQEMARTESAPTEAA